MNPTTLTSTERRAVISLSSIMGLRMLGLFMVLPVFVLYAQQLTGATPALVGIAVGIYGLAQAIFQIPFGVLSDHFGRKPLILMGLLIFIMGSLIAALSSSIHLMIIGRTLQGVGAIGSTLLALMADLTRDEQRTKAMAIAGITIGFSFSLAMLAGPLFTNWIPVNCLFYLSALCGAVAIFILYYSVPTPTIERWHRDAEPELHSFLALLKMPELIKLNSGIFVLHAIFTASFIVIPISLLHFANLPANQQWLVYVPTLLAAFVIVLLCASVAERKQLLKVFFLGSILTLSLAEVLLWLAPTNRLLTTIGLCLFFAGFSLLEAFLPSLISRTAPAARKGSALGIFSCAQFLGIFVGGALGGWLYGQYSFSGVYLFCLLLSLFWLALAFLMQPPRHLVTEVLHLRSPQQQWETFVEKLHVIPGMVEVTLIASDKMVYLKMDQSTRQHPEFIRLKEQLQTDLRLGE